MILCEYGCGQEAKYQFKNGKWCCSDFVAKCLKVRRKNSEKNIGRIDSIETRILKSESMKGKKSPHKGKKYEEIYGEEKALQLKKQRSSSFLKNRKQIILKLKLTINKIKRKYTYFSQIEEMRYNPDKPGEKEIQVHCKNHLCSNSKEQGGWFTPTADQLRYRIYAIEKVDGNDGYYLYCSDDCKKVCPLYGSRGTDPYKDKIKYITDNEYQIFREHVLKRDNYKCCYCGKPAEHVHHERPQKLEPFYSLDPDYAWSVCSKCHYEKGHKEECSIGEIIKTKCKGE